MPWGTRSRPPYWRLCWSGRCVTPAEPALGWQSRRAAPTRDLPVSLKGAALSPASSRGSTYVHRPRRSSTRAIRRRCDCATVASTACRSRPIRRSVSPAATSIAFRRCRYSRATGSCSSPTACWSETLKASISQPSSPPVARCTHARPCSICLKSSLTPPTASCATTRRRCASTGTAGRPIRERPTPARTPESRPRWTARMTGGLGSARSGVDCPSAPRSDGSRRGSPTSPGAPGGRCPPQIKPVTAQDLVSNPAPGYSLVPSDATSTKTIVTLLKAVLRDSRRGHDEKVLARDRASSGTLLLVVNSTEKTGGNNDIVSGILEGTKASGDKTEEITVRGQTTRLVRTGDGAYTTVAPAGDCAVVMLISDSEKELRRAAKQ